MPSPSGPDLPGRKWSAIESAVNYDDDSTKSINIYSDSPWPCNRKRPVSAANFNLLFVGFR